MTETTSHTFTSIRYCEFCRFAGSVRVVETVTYGDQLRQTWQCPSCRMHSAIVKEDS